MPTTQPPKSPRHRAAPRKVGLSDEMVIFLVQKSGLSIASVRRHYSNGTTPRSSNDRKAWAAALAKLKALHLPPTWGTSPEKTEGSA